MKSLGSLWWLPMLGGVILLCVAALLPSWRSHSAAEPTTGVVLDVLLDTKTNSPWHGEFVTRHKGVYDLVLAIGRTADEPAFRTSDCLLGAMTDSRDCGSTRSIVDVAWRLRRNAQAARSEDTQAIEAGTAVGPASAMSYSSDYIERHLANFRASPDEWFALSVSCGPAWVPIKGVKPRLRVRPSTILMEELVLQSVVQSLFWKAGPSVVALCGIVAMTVGYVMRRRSAA